MAFSGALFGRTDLARLLHIPPWLLANFADRRYPYGLAPRLPGGKGRGKKGLYTLWDVYKIATAYRMFLCDLNARLIGDAVRELFPRYKAPMEIAVKERATDEASARCLLIDLYEYSKGTWMTQLPEDSRSVAPPEWKGKHAPGKRALVALRPRNAIAEEFRLGTLRALCVIPFDETLNWVDSQVLGREVTFAGTQETKER
jgi:hypothetical protein